MFRRHSSGAAPDIPGPNTPSSDLFDELASSPPPALAEDLNDTSSCWGALLQGEASQCTPNFVIGKAHFVRARTPPRAHARAPIFRRVPTLSVAAPSGGAMLAAVLVL